MSEWRKVRKPPVMLEARPAGPEDENLIRTGEDSVVDKWGLRAYGELWPHYMVMRGAIGDEFPVEKTVFNDRYEEIEEA